MVKQPEPDPDDPEGYPGYDPTRSPEAEGERREPVGLRPRPDGQAGGNLKYLTPDEDAAIMFPDDLVKPYDADAGNGSRTSRPVWWSTTC